MASKNKASNGRDWGMVAGGVLIIILGFLLYVFPGFSALNLAIVAGIALLCVGVFEIASYIRNRKRDVSSGWTIVSAICSLVLGILFLVHPLITATAVVWVLGWFIIVYGIFAIVLAISMRKNAGFAWGLMLLNGIVSVLCGIMFNTMPESFVIFLGIFLIFRGITMVVYGFASPGSVKYI